MSSKERFNKRSSHKSPKSNRSETRPAGKSGKAGFSFKDRSGKVHSLGGGGIKASSPGSGSSVVRPHAKPEKKFEKRHPKHTKQEHRGRGPHREHRHDRRPERFENRTQKLKATVDKNHKGFGFLIFETKGIEDVFVPPRQAESLFHGDRVEVTLGHRGEVFDLKVIEHRFRELVGRYTPHPVGHERGGWVVYERKRAREEVFVPKSDGKIKANDWVRAKLHFHQGGPFPVTAEITEIYGQELPASADIGMISAEYNLVEEHPAAAEQEAKALPSEITEEEIREELRQGRVDLRNIPFITIDGETARDFDDAVYVERKKSGFILWVGIADVSHYVRPASAIDKSARSRGTSVYFPERAFHMLPRALSENLCSLRPHVPRMTLVARIELDRNGKKLDTEVMEAVIESRRRATYNEIEAEWKRNQKDSNWEYTPHFSLYQVLRKMRAQRGSIDFDLPEAELLVDPNGEVISISQRERLDAHRLIEEFMICANEAVTEWIMERNWPFVYRVHDEPAAESLEKFEKLASTVGIHFSLEAGSSPRVMAELVRRLEGHAAQTMLNMALLRSMKQAVYSATHGIHYGLASEAYTHFTSPIRRYPDLVVHRLLRHALRVDKKKEPQLKKPARDHLEKDLQETCEHCSYRERLASDAERESIKLKQVRAMVPKLGDEFKAKVVGMVDSGIFVKIKEPYVEGMVNKESMTDDFYEFNEDRMIFYGRRKRRTFKIGDEVKVQAVRADIDRRQIDFSLVG